MGKICFICNTEKDLSEFYKHPKMGDGYLGKCKECTKKSSKIRDVRLRESPEYVEKEKVRARDKYHRLNYRERQYELNKHKPYKTALYKGLHKKIKCLGIVSTGYELHHWNYNVINDFFIIKDTDHRRIHTQLILSTETLVFSVKDGETLSTFQSHAKFLSDNGVQYRHMIFKNKKEYDLT